MNGGFPPSFNSLTMMSTLNRILVDHIRLTAPEFAAKDYSQFDAFVFFIPLHGGSNDAISGVNGETISVAEFMCFFKSTVSNTLK